jgi:hypothetical protein
LQLSQGPCDGNSPCHGRETKRATLAQLECDELIPLPGREKCREITTNVCHHDRSGLRAESSGCSPPPQTVFRGPKTRAHQFLLTINNQNCLVSATDNGFRATRGHNDAWSSFDLEVSMFGIRKDHRRLGERTTEFVCGSKRPDASERNLATAAPSAHQPDRLVSAHSTQTRPFTISAEWSCALVTAVRRSAR